MLLAQLPAGYTSGQSFQQGGEVMESGESYCIRAEFAAWPPFPKWLPEREEEEGNLGFLLFFGVKKGSYHPQEEEEDCPV